MIPGAQGGNPLSQALDTRRLALISGKGGTGKSLVALSLALEAAARGKRVLLACIRETAALRHLYALPDEASQQLQLPGHAAIQVMRIEAGPALSEYARIVLNIPLVHRAIFDSRGARAFLQAVPGLDAWAMLGKVYYHAHRDQMDGAARYDLVIMDGPATGHFLEMLQVPFTIRQVAPPGLLRREANEACALFCDPSRCMSIVVGLAERLAARETAELCERLPAMGLPKPWIVWNQLLDAAAGPAVQEALRSTGLQDAAPQTHQRLAHLSEGLRAQALQLAHFAGTFDLPSLQVTRRARRSLPESFRTGAHLLATLSSSNAAPAS